MKEYCGFPGATDESNNQLLVRNKGTKLVPVFHHVRDGIGIWEWGKDEGAQKDLIRSLVFDVFSVGQCPTFPDKCVCDDSLWTNKLGVPDNFDVEMLYNRLESRFFKESRPREQFKLNQVELCDFIFDYVHDSKIELSLEAIANEIKEPELV